MNIKHITYHLLFWLAIMVLFAISEWGHGQSFKDAVIFELLYLPTRVIAVYVNWFILIPKYLYKNNFGLYVFLLVVILIITAIIHRYFVLYWGYPMYFPQWVDGKPIDPLNFFRLVQCIMLIATTVAFTTGFKLYSDWFKQRNETEVLKQEKTNAELKFLKSQTNPHFLFNTLNSIYGLALENSKKTPALILKLSDILSYTLYESNTEKVALNKELTLIENIIALEKERYEKRVDINYRVEGNVESVEIPPLILVPFIENAFKHGLKNEVKKGWITIQIKVSTSELFFTLENSISKLKEEDIKEGGGLGLQNVTRRLDLIYGKDKDLHIRRNNNSFIVNLTIKLTIDES
ncbi:histidine kinase [uncultured Aquimarina sp.]|uniref:sensor histidine kinase n=1 Tax=uncultured Aquimarina sp. TaxID=575652 RepID=UPI00262F2908|nr:histidine kinase [uncultured Aquimarina sp.]